MGKIFNEGLTPELLDEMFRSDEKCYQFLADLKWAQGEMETLSEKERNSIEKILTS